MLKDNLIARHMLFQQKKPHLENLNDLREKGIETFERIGFPTKKNEDWKYTHVSSLINKEYQLNNTADVNLDYNEVKKYFLHEIDSYKIVFVNGVFSSFLSESTHDEADICILSSAIDKDKYHTVLENYLGKIAPDQEHFVALNNAFTKEGAYVYIPKGVHLSKPIQLVFLTSENNEESFQQYRNLIIVEDNAEVQIIERHQSLGNQANFSNSVTEVHVGKNANLDYYKIQNDTEEAALIDHTYIEQERDSEAKVHTFSLGGKFTRNTLNVYQKGVNSNTVLNGITLTHKEQFVDHHTLIHHFAPNCKSYELYRGILDGKSKSVFNGKVIVNKEAQQLSAFQQNNNILLTDTVSIDTKPQLEIFADDVRCSHGCTVGQLDEEALFYMQARGIPQAKAKALLLYAFNSDVLENVAIPAIKDRIQLLIAKKMKLDLEF